MSRRYSALVCSAIAGHANALRARSRPALPIAAARAGSASRAFTRSAKSRGERLGVARLAGPVIAGLDRDEQAGLAVDDDLDDAAGRGRHDGRLARHRLEVDDPERLVDRRAGEHGRVARAAG